MKIERHAVHAVALAGRLRTVVENVAEMAAAAAAMNFGARHEKTAVGVGFDRLVERRRKARPSGATVELGVRREKRLTATGAVIDPGAVLLIEGARSGTFGAVLPQHPVLRRRELTPPLLLAERNRKGFPRGMTATAQAAEKTLCHALPFGVDVQPIEYRLDRASREGPERKRVQEFSAPARLRRGSDAAIPPSSGRSNTRRRKSARHRRCASVALRGARFPQRQRRAGEREAVPLPKSCARWSSSPGSS